MEELYILSEEHGTGKIVSINEAENTAKVEYEDGFEEDIDLDDEFDFDFEDEDEDEEKSDEVEDEVEDADLEENLEDLEEGRGKKGQARQASRNSDDEFGYEKRGSKPSKGRFNLDRARKNQFQESADLLGLALDKKPTEFSAELSNILQARIADRLEDLKLNIAQNLYNKENEVENS